MNQISSASKKQTIVHVFSLVLIPGRDLIAYHVQMLKVLTILCVILIPQSVFASNFSTHTFSGFQSITHPIPQGDFETLAIPLKRAQNLLLIEARINDLEGNFILDTGAPYLVLNKTYFRNALQTNGTRSAGLTGESSMLYTTRVDRLEILDLFYEDLKADAVNLGHIEDGKGVKILGLLGANLFAEMEMEIDVANNLLYLHKLDQNGERLNSEQDAPLPKETLQIPIDLVNNIVFINASAHGKKLRFCLDTGAEISILSNAVSKKVLQGFQLKSRNTLMGSGNRREVTVLGGELDRLLIGDHRFSNMQVVLTGLNELQSVYNTTVHGILGYNFFAEGRVIVNFKKKQLRVLFYSPHRDDVDPYFSGL